MESDIIPCSEFINLELDTLTSNVNGLTLKQEKQLSASQRRYYSFCRRKVSVNRNIDWCMTNIVLICVHLRKRG